MIIVWIAWADDTVVVIKTAQAGMRRVVCCDKKDRYIGSRQ